MTSLYAVAALLCVAAVTPGPNNLIVMRTAARTGLVGALPAITGIVAGSLALLGAVVAGLGGLFGACPPLRILVGIGGALYMIWLGLRLALPARSGHPERDLPAGLPGLFVFQFLNPKGWLMMLAVVAASPAAAALDTFARLAPLAACIPAACLLLWAGLGHALSRQLARPLVRVWTDRVLGVLLIASALPLLA